jgi:hypothetical protein
MSKHLDDLVLAFSVMLGNLSFGLVNYDEYLKSVSEPSQLKLGFIPYLINDLTISISSTESINYSIDPEVKKLIDESIINFSKLGIKTIDLSNYVTLSEIKDLIKLTFIKYPSLFDCLDNCRKLAIDRYFGDSDRFQSDSPYSNFDSLFNSPLLSLKWQNIFAQSNVSNPEQTCRSSCTTYEEFLVEFNNEFIKWFQIETNDEIDALLLPTSTQLPPLLGN